jgi:hypothetical protein
VVVVVVVPHPPAVTQVKCCNCLDICQSKLALPLHPICLLGIAISLNNYGVVVVVVVVEFKLLAVTLISNSNCLEICHNRFSSVPQPICLDGIAMTLNFIYYTKISIFLL